MSDNRPKLIVVCGPTATGKTAMAIRLAKACNGEIINADSMQVYRHMNVGTAKPTAQEQAAANFHLIDVTEPNDTFSAGRFKEMGDAAIASILARGYVPIIAGGTGLYIKALIRGLFEGPRADRQLRAQYKAQEAAEPGSLHRRLAQIDPERASEVNVADFVRIERSLEVFDLTGIAMSRWQREHRFAEEPYRVLQIGLHRERKELATACDRRVEQMMETGWLAEVRELRRLGFGPELPSQAAIGYKELHMFLDKKISLAEAKQRTQANTRKFAKRQRTWFGADQSIRWFDVLSDLDAAERAALDFCKMD